MDRHTGRKSLIQAVILLLYINRPETTRNVEYNLINITISILHPENILDILICHVQLHTAGPLFTKKTPSYGYRDRLGFILGLPILIRRRLPSEYSPWGNGDLYISCFSLRNDEIYSWNETICIWRYHIGSRAFQWQSSCRVGKKKRGSYVMSVLNYAIHIYFRYTPSKRMQIHIGDMYR